VNVGFTFLLLAYDVSGTSWRLDHAYTAGLTQPARPPTLTKHMT